MPVDKKYIETSNRSASKTKFAVLRTDRSILLIAVFVLALINIYTVVKANNAVEASRNSREVVWVKMFPDGKSEIEDFRPEDEQPVFVRTVNASLTRYVHARFKLHPETIRRDYAEAGVFMSQPLFSRFTDRTAFNAVEKANTIAANPNTESRKDVSNVRLDHYDQIEGDFSGQKKPVVRTTITWDETAYSSAGRANNDAQARMMRITWTLLSRDEVSQKSTGWLNINPLGIVILSQEEL